MGQESKRSLFYKQACRQLSLLEAHQVSWGWGEGQSELTLELDSKRWKKKRRIEIYLHYINTADEQKLNLEQNHDA